jgi:hypothetical protein
LPKKEGGLGVKNLEVWNRVAMIKNLWSMFVIQPNLFDLHGYLLICCEVGVCERFAALEIVHGAGERFSVCVVWF